MSTAFQFAGVSFGAKNSYAVGCKRCPVDTVLRRPPYAEPLPRDRVPVLEPGIADIALRYRSLVRKLSGDPVRVCTGFLDPQPVVFAVIAELDVQSLSDDEVGRF